MKNELTREMVLQTMVALLSMGLAVLSLMFMAVGLGPARKLNFPDERMMPVPGSVTEAVGWMSSRGNLLIPLPSPCGSPGGTSRPGGFPTDPAR